MEEKFYFVTNIIGVKCDLYDHLNETLEKANANVRFGPSLDMNGRLEGLGLTGLYMLEKDLAALPKGIRKLVSLEEALELEYSQRASSE